MNNRINITKKYEVVPDTNKGIYYGKSKYEAPFLLADEEFNRRVQTSRMGMMLIK